MTSSTTALTVRVLGEPALIHGGRVLACGSKKSLALFVYLVLTRRRHSRSAVAALLWGGDPEAARTSLRTALQRLPAEAAGCIEAQRDSVGLAAGVAIEADALRFEECADAEAVADLEAASELYQGELLHGFDADAAPPFDDWLLAERTRYRQLAQSVFDRLIARHREVAMRDVAAAASERASALAAARRWLAVEPAAEAAHRWLMQLLVESGQQEGARAQYELCRRALAVAFGRAPSPETRALYDSLSDARESAPPPALPGNLHEAVVPSTPFVGRLEDLAALDALLADASCRLLTLHGMGGCGKTRLAHVLAQQVLPRFAQGATWIALESVGDADGAAVAIARALHIEAAAARQGARPAICAALSRQQRLLVLDNVEPLLAGEQASDRFVDLVLALLAAAPAVRVLVTSREALRVSEEWVYEVQGLAVPGQGDDAIRVEGAAELFVQRARQAYLGFSAAAEWPHIVRICRLVEGLPLALELSAAWVRTIPCGEIAAQLEAQAAALDGNQLDRPARQRSLDAVVAFSWQLLDASLRPGLAALSVFAASFAHEAARAVADASLRQISVLIDKSLVQRRPDGRLALHPIVRAFAAVQLRGQDDRGDEALRRHAAWFVELLQRCRSRLDGPDEIEAEGRLGAERDEIARAVEGCLDRAETERLDAVCEPLLRMLMSRSAFRDVESFARRFLAQERLNPAARAMALGFEARALAMLGRRDAAAEGFARAAHYADDHGLAYARDFADVYAVVVPYEAGDVAGALRRLDTLEARAGGWPRDLQMRLRYTQGVVLDSAGALARAEAALREALALAQQLEAPIAIATVESQLATALLRRGRRDAAVPLLRTALDVFERVGRLHDVARLSNALAVAALWTGELSTAEQRARRSLKIFEEVGFSGGQSAAADTLGQALLRQGRGEDARVQFERAIERAADTAMSFEPRYHLVDASLRSGDVRSALRALTLMVKAADAYDGHDAVARYTLLAAARVAVGRDDAKARRWAAALLTDPDLDADLRGEAESIAGDETAVEPGKVEWSAFRDEVAALLRHVPG